MLIYQDTEIAFKHLSDKDLKNAYRIFSAVKSPWLVKIGSKLVKWLIQIRFPFVEAMMKKTVFKHFCGGVDIRDALPVVHQQYENGVYSILDYAVEGKASDSTFDSVTEEVMRNISIASGNPAIPFVVFKPTGIGDIELYTAVSESKNLNDEQQAAWERILQRYEKIAQYAYEQDVTLMIDAEETWMQKAADEIAENLMKKFNVYRCIICNTLQMYRTDRLEYLKKQYEKAKQGGYFIGYKLVRGAYMEKERARAEEMGYPSPIHPNKEETDKAFDEAAKFCLENREIISLYAGTHNELSCKKITDFIIEHNIPKNFHKIWMGQLLGMSDNITYTLAKEGFNVSKYVPYGPVRDVVPYLIRRAEENTSVSGQTGRELFLIKKEIERRKRLST